MLKSVLDSYDELQKLLADHRPKKLKLVTAINYDLLKDLTAFLYKFVDVTKLFESENKRILNIVIPKMAGLKKH